jgi:hypothetical protein
MKTRNLGGVIFLALHLSLFPVSLASSCGPAYGSWKAALLYSGTDPEELQRWKSRSRWAPALPHLLVGYDQKAANQVNNNIQDSISVSSAGVTLGPPQNTFTKTTISTAVSK